MKWYERSSGIATILLAAVLMACGGEGAADGGDQEAPVPGEEAPASGSEILTLDYGPQDPIDGFRRFEGSCSTFPYNLQHPENWEMQPTGGYAISKTRSDDTEFFIRIHEDHGSIHAANLERLVMDQGAEEVGRIDVGGHEVRVLGRDAGLMLHTPHGVGAMFHNLGVSSSLGVEETLRILDTLEPLEDC